MSAPYVSLFDRDESKMTKLEGEIFNAFTRSEESRGLLFSQRLTVVDRMLRIMHNAIKNNEIDNG